MKKLDSFSWKISLTLIFSVRFISNVVAFQSSTKFCF